jgi:formylglycine-generating enzyme required for sulfatase activity
MPRQATASVRSAWCARSWRLPIKAEREYAARAGSTTRRPRGDDEVSCVFGNGTDRTIGPRGRTSTERALCKGYWFAAPVTTFRPNAWGLHIMPGNLWEWAQDCFLPYPEAPSDGSAHETGPLPGSRAARRRVGRAAGGAALSRALRQGARDTEVRIRLRVARELAP